VLTRRLVIARSVVNCCFGCDDGTLGVWYEVGVVMSAEVGEGASGVDT